MDYSKLNACFLEYINDARRYAVALQGPWGSGKTYYVEQVLAPLLKKAEFKVLRVSMFGISDADELYSRIVMAWLGVPDRAEDASSRSKLKMLAGHAKSIAISFGTKEISKLGVSVNATPRMLFDLVCNDKQLIVFDDMERADPGFADNALFGTINDLVEARGMKIVVVTNDITKIGAETREKVIWKAFDLNPDFGDLARDVFGPMAGAISGVPIVELLAKAAAEVECDNVRAMIKAKPLIEMMASSVVLADASRAESSRAGAFIEAAGFAFRCASGRPPVKPEESDGKTMDSDWLKAGAEEATFEHYCSIPVISDYFSAGGHPTQMSVDESLAGFMDLYYPDSSGAVRMKEALSCIRCVTEMDEEGAIAAVREFASCVASAEYDISDLAKVVSMAASMRSIGIDGSPTTAEVLSSGQQLIASDVIKAYQRFHVGYMAWGMGLYNADPETLAALDSYCVGLYRKRKLPDASTLDESPEAYFEGLERLVPSDGSMPEFDVLLAAEPLNIVTCSCQGSPTTQLGINRLFRRIVPHANRLADFGRSASEWLDAIAMGLGELDSLGPVARHRRGWVLKSIEDLKRELDGRGVEDS